MTRRVCVCVPGVDWPRVVRTLATYCESLFQYVFRYCQVNTCCGSERGARQRPAESAARTRPDPPPGPPKSHEKKQINCCTNPQSESSSTKPESWYTIVWFCVFGFGQPEPVPGYPDLGQPVWPGPVPQTVFWVLDIAG
eukprot:933568-Rhodomonas_salina.1